MAAAKNAPIMDPEGHDRRAPGLESANRKVAIAASGLGS
jgi:hypothetical protein